MDEIESHCNIIKIYSMNFTGISTLASFIKICKKKEFTKYLHKIKFSDSQ